MEANYTNEQLLIALREELLRRKFHVDAILNFVECDINKFSFKLLGWSFLDDDLLISISVRNVSNPYKKFTTHCLIVDSNGNYKISCPDVIKVDDKVALQNYLYKLYRQLKDSFGVNKEYFNIVHPTELKIPDSNYLINYSSIDDSLYISKLSEEGVIDLDYVFDILNRYQTVSNISEDIIKFYESFNSYNIAFDGEPNSSSAVLHVRKRNSAIVLTEK